MQAIKTQFAPLLYMLFAIFHIGLSSYYAVPYLVTSDERFYQVIVPSEIVTLYANYTGSDKHYGFFAPGVAPDVRILFEIEDLEKGCFTEEFALPEANSEISHRLYTIQSVFAKVTEFQDFGATSLAAAMFNKYPTAKQVEVQVEVMDTPTMKEYQKGDRPNWVRIYASTFQKKIP